MKKGTTPEREKLSLNTLQQLLQTRQTEPK